MANAGVYDFGAAQSLRRAEIEKSAYETIIFSIFIKDDFHRDKFLIKSGLPRTALIKKDDVYWDTVPEKTHWERDFSPKKTETSQLR